MDLKKIKEKDDIVIVVTDSGLGGISIMAELEMKLRKKNSFNKVRLVFFNALKGHSSGYNTMRTMDEKAEVFDKALNKMKELYKPDMIFIACNTLSVVYPNTTFAKKSKIPVVEIVEYGVEQFYEKLSSEEDSNLVLFGTPTTISSMNHRNKLVEKGIDPKRVIPQSCFNLESEIQMDPAGSEVEKLLEEYAEKSMAKFDTKKGKVFAGLCCTHYGYSKKMIQEVLNTTYGTDVELLNPNNRMSSVFDDLPNGEGKSEIEVNIISRVDIPKSERDGIGVMVGKNSPLTKKALGNYIMDKDLF